MKVFFDTNINDSLVAIMKLAFQTSNGSFYGFERDMEDGSIKTCSGEDAKRFGVKGYYSDCLTMKFETMYNALRRCNGSWDMCRIVDFIEGIDAESIAKLVSESELHEFAKFFLPVEEDCMSCTYGVLKRRYNECAEKIAAGLIMKLPSSRKTCLARLNKDIIASIVPESYMPHCTYCRLKGGKMYRVYGVFSKYAVLMDGRKNPCLVEKEKLEGI